jgi:hypothetical protein
VSIKVRFDEGDPRILVVDQIPPMSWDEVMDALREVLEIGINAPQAIVIVWDATLMKTLPTASNPLGQLRELITSRPQNILAFVYVGGSAMGRQLISILKRALFLRWMLTASTLDEGYSLAREKLSLQAEQQGY